jgi:diacylglycerol kinase family enzyme
LIEFAKLTTETYNIDIDNGREKFENVTTNFMLVMNSKFGGGHMCLSPVSIMNDGLSELCFYKKVVGRKQAL